MKSNYKPRNSLIAAVDIGSTKVACFIARMIDDEGRFEIVGVGHQASAGIRAGVITDIDAAEAAIRNVVHAAENRAADIMKGYPLRDVVVNMSGIHALSRHVPVDVQVMGHDITDNDIRRALVKAQEFAGTEGYELIHSIPVGYRIDGHDGIRKPQGLHGQNLQVDVHVVSGEQGALKNMTACIENSHLDIAALCLSPYAAGLSSLVEDEMDLGCTVIDMGGGLTSIAVFRDNAMIYADALPVGGLHVTKDIARGLTTSLTSAERLKTLYGSAIMATTDESELIDVPQLGEEGVNHAHHVPRSLLVGIIQPRMEETLEMIRAKLEDSGIGPTLGRRVVLTGGASQLPGVRELAQLVLEKQVRLGRPIRIGGLVDTASGPAFATTAGLLSYISSRGDEIPGEVRANVEPVSAWARVKMWLRENW